MSDLIRVVDLEVRAHIGVSDAERTLPQRLLITLEMSVDCFSKAASTDDIAATVNYFEVAQRVEILVSERPRKLLETLAEEIAAHLLKTFAIQKLRLEIKKFILSDARHVAVEIVRYADKNPTTPKG